MIIKYNQSTGIWEKEIKSLLPVNDEQKKYIFIKLKEEWYFLYNTDATITKLKVDLVEGKLAIVEVLEKENTFELSDLQEVGLSLIEDAFSKFKIINLFYPDYKMDRAFYIEKKEIINLYRTTDYLMYFFIHPEKMKIDIFINYKKGVNNE